MFLRNISLIFLTLLIISCGSQNTRPDNQAYPGLEQAQLKYQNHDYEDAVLTFQNLYKKYHKQEFAILAADCYLQLYQYEKSQQIISQLLITNNALYTLIKAELLLVNKYPQKSYELINQLQNNVPADLQNRYMILKSRIESANSDYLQAALTLISYQKQNDTEKFSDEILNNLLLVSEYELTEALFNVSIGELEQGWLEAAFIAGSQDESAINDWYRRWSKHPARIFFTQINRYKNIAVLLPLTGKYKNISKSIQQGMIASLYRNGSSQQQLRFFDTGSDGENFSYAWFGAIESGADFIIGPLEKKSISQFAKYNSNTVPVMLLNSAENEENIYNYFQFSLSVEDEITSAVNRLINENKKRIMLLAPESSSSRDLAIKFEQLLLQNGGEVVSYQFYPPSVHDYSREMKQALGLDDSLIRARKLQTAISHKLNISPQIRPDIDAVFILANPKQARLIKPQLKFFKAEDLPVYATSQILSLSPDPNLDKDLNGIKFTQSAFVINPQAYQGFLNFDVKQIHQNRKFFAFGYDAIALSPRLEWLQKVQKNTIQGMSGQLYVDPDGVVHRKLAWSQFIKGSPVLLPDSNTYRTKSVNTSEP